MRISDGLLFPFEKKKKSYIDSLILYAFTAGLPVRL